jgi:serine/threonine protein kinase
VAAAVRGSRLAMGLTLPAQFGKYILLDLIARGGMAEVFRAKSKAEVGGVERLYAIKIMLPEVSENREFINSLINEAKISVTLSHSNIAQVYDLGLVGETYYLAMEFVHGRDLHGVIEDLESAGGRFPVQHALYVIMGMLAGLDVAHRKRDSMGQPLRIVHRDISPHNVLISYAGDVKIIDFGIARAANKLGATRRGVIKGKLLYMAPEQARAQDIDARADLFAVAMTLYRMLTGILPFDAANQFEIYRKVIECDVPDPRHYASHIPEPLVEVLHTALQRDPDKRFPDAYAFRDRLDSILTQLAPGYGQDTFRRFIESQYGTPPLPGESAIYSTEASKRTQPPTPLPPSTGSERPAWAKDLPPHPERPPDELDDKPTIARLDSPSPQQLQAAREQRAAKQAVRRTITEEAASPLLLVSWGLPVVFGLLLAVAMALLTYLALIL